MLEFVESSDEKSDEEEEEEDEKMKHVTNDFLAAFAGCDVGDIGPAMSHSGFHFHDKRLRRRRSVIETNTRLKEIRCISNTTENTVATSLSEAQRLGDIDRGIRTYRSVLGFALLLQRADVVLCWQNSVLEQLERRVLSPLFSERNSSK